MTVRKCTLWLMVLALFAGPMDAQDSLHVQRLLKEWRAIDSTTAGLAASGSSTQRPGVIVAMNTRIKSANALLDTLSHASGLPPYGSALGALRLLPLDPDTVNLRNARCLAVDQAMFESAIISAVTRKVSAEQCTLEELGSRTLERQTLLVAILESAERVKVRQTLSLHTSKIDSLHALLVGSDSDPDLTGSIGGGLRELGNRVETLTRKVDELRAMTECFAADSPKARRTAQGGPVCSLPCSAVANRASVTSKPRCGGSRWKTVALLLSVAAGGILGGLAMK